MTRVARFRSHTFTDPGGTYKQYVNGALSYTHQWSAVRLTGTMSDSHGRPVVDSPMTSSQRTRYVEPVSGAAGNATFNGIAEGLFPQGPAGTIPAHLSLPALPSTAVDINSVLVRTNPSRPEITPFSLIQDLVDIPRQLKDVGKLIKSPKRILNQREIANQYLGLQFGWLPLIKDVQDLIDLGSHIDRRVKELHDLYSNNGLKRRLTLHDDHAAADTKNVTFESNVNLTIVGTYSDVTHRRRWATVRWLPTSLPSWYHDDARILKEAKRISLGLTVEGLYKGAWDVLPWTWLLNWFTNVGNYALQFSNAVPATPSVVNLMTMTETTRRFSVTGMTGGYSGGGGYVTQTDKSRVVGGGTITANIPFIGISRLSVLSALFVQRFKR